MYVSGFICKKKTKHWLHSNSKSNGKDNYVHLYLHIYVHTYVYMYAIIAKLYHYLSNNVTEQNF